MIDKESKKAISEILNNKDTDVICMFSRTGDMDGVFVVNEDHVDSAWDTVDIFLNMLIHEFEKPHQNSLVLTRFLNKLGYFPTQSEVEGAYNRFHAPVDKNVN